MALTPEAAFENVQKVVRAFQGNADQHDILRESLRTLAERVNLAAELEKAAAATKEVVAAKPANGSKSDATPAAGSTMEA